MVRVVIVLIFWCLSVVASAGSRRYSEWMVESEMRRAPQSWSLDGGKGGRWSYVMGVELEAFWDVWLNYGDRRVRDYCVTWVDSVVGTDGSLVGCRLEDWTLDGVRAGHLLARMRGDTDHKGWSAAVDRLMCQLDCHPRTECGIWWHKMIYAGQVWLDGSFMGAPFRTLVAADVANEAVRDSVLGDVVDQLCRTYDRTFDPLTGLNRHAWDETKSVFWADRETGQSRHCWGRAEGWFTLALLEFLDGAPKNFFRRTEILALVRRSLEAIVRWQDKRSGVWWQVMDCPDYEGNYKEASCSAMFAYALLKASRLGYVGKRFRRAGVRAYEGVLREFVRDNGDGTISLTNCCSVAGLGPGAGPNVKRPNLRRDGTCAYYVSEPVVENDGKGVGPFIWASLEWERLHKKNK